MRLKRVLRRLSGKRPPNETPIADLPAGKVGHGTYGPTIVRSFTDSRGVSIGSYCSFGPDTEIWLGGNHRMDWVTTYPFTILDPRWAHIDGGSKSKGDVEIGSDVWMGQGALILSGVRVGHGAVIGARAVVGRDVPPYSVVAGNPAKVVRSRFPQETIDRLLAIAWWNWDEAKVQRAVPLMMSDDIDAFLSAAEGGLI